MDPYLEDAGSWPTLHHWLITVLGESLTARLAPDYVVSIEERVYIVDDADPAVRQVIAPDIAVVERAGPRPASGSEALVVTPPTLIERLPVLEVRDRYLAIYDAHNRELITIMEVLSPRNKLRRSRGRRQFVAKREAVLAARTHWIEIDLLRGGERPVEVAGTSDYYVLLHRGGDSRLEVWYVNLRDRLPVIAVPVRAPHADVLLDVQAALDSVYTRARFADRIEYDQPPPPPALSPADAAWAATCIASWQRDRE